MECFKWAVIASMKWEEIDRDHQRVSKLRRYEREFDWSDIEFPVSFRDINKFERNNEIGVNILAIETKKIYICRKGRYYDRIVNLMLIADVENPNKKHYVAVKSLSRLLSKQNCKHKEAQHFCTNCLNGFESKIIRDEHYEYCRSRHAVRVEMPTKNPIVKYADGQYQFKVPFVIYADFESILVLVSGAPNNPEMSSTRGINVHQPSGWCMHSKFVYRKVTNPLKQYRGRDCISKFCEHIMVEAKRLYKSAPREHMDKLTKEQNVEFVTAKECHICFTKFSSKDRKVRDHCHYTGKYRGAAHSSCNLSNRIPDYIPVVFHNLAGYDAHLFIKELAKHTSKIGVIAKNTENYISFSVKVEVDKFIDKAGNEKSKEIELRFIDSFKFMSSSLDSVVNNLAKGGHEFWGFVKHDSKQKELLIRKGVYPYEYMDSWDRFEEKRLPSIDECYSKLNMSRISEKDYQHACKVWNEFGLKNMGDYHDLYLETDVLLLANVFESFRKVCLDNYELDPAHFYTAPGLAWKACLKKTGVNLELLKDPDMLLMFERGIRGGITQLVHKWAIANNPYMGCEYDPLRPTNYLQYLDANNLYGWAMSQPLPTEEFKWVDIENLKGGARELKRTIDMMVRNSNRGYGYVLEVDVKYPRELHDLHNDLPFMCEKIRVSGVEKLVPNFHDKQKYVIHVKALKQALDHDSVLERIHRVIQFKQSVWMKEYIDFNTRLRTVAKNDFEKDFYKLMNNSVFGKTMENIRKHRDIKLVNNKEDYLKQVMTPNFKGGVLMGANLMSCEMGKVKVKMNKPVYLGQAILDLSKTIMYEFHYDYMKRKYNESDLKLLYMDTDSLVYNIETEDFYKDIAENVETRFDTSGYEPDRPLRIGKNKKVIGLMKDELSGKIMKEFIRLRPKMYSYRVEESEPKKCKGIKKRVVKKTISFEDYKRCLLEGRVIHRSQMIFRSKKHNVRTLVVNKLALSREDDKRISINGIDKLAMGDKNLLSYQ